MATARYISLKDRAHILRLAKEIPSITDREQLLTACHVIIAIVEMGDRQSRKIDPNKVSRMALRESQ